MSYEEKRVSLLSFPHLYIFTKYRSDWLRNILRNIIHIEKLKLLDFLLLALYGAMIFAAYDQKRQMAYIPNEEIRMEFMNAVEDSHWN